MFAPCEKVIIDQQNNPSLIAVFQELTVALPSLEGIPENAGSPMRWFIFTLWGQDADDAGKRYEQACDLLLPDGRKAVPSRTAFSMEQRWHRNIIEIHGFPVAREPGDCLLRLSLREDTEGAEWREVATFPLIIKHEQPK
jgi:hypothetical protein